MSAEWKAGITPLGSLVVWSVDRWRWADTGTACVDQPPPDLRPLVLIDPEDEEQVERLADIYDYGGSKVLVVRRLQAALREYASPTPPKPDEPMGLGAVVVDADGKKWIAHEPDGGMGANAYRWVPAGSMIGEARVPYADISAVEVLSAGVES